MTYPIKNGSNFSAAFAGAMSGMEGSGLGSGQTNSTAATYATNATIAFAFAQQVDTVLGAAALQSVQVALIEELAFAAFKDRNPGGGASAGPELAATWNEEAVAIQAILVEANAVIAAQATTPPPTGGNQFVQGKNAAATGAALTTTYDVSADVPGGYIPKTTGFLMAIFTMSVLDATPDLAIVFQARIAGAADAASPTPSADGGDIGNACVTITRIYPCVAGTAINPGIQATAANNVNSAIGKTGFTLVELQAA